MTFECDVTPFADSLPPHESTASYTPYWYTNREGSLWAGPLRSLQGRWYAEWSTKVLWWRAGEGRLTVHGRRLDAAAPPLIADVATEYGLTGMNPSYLEFPTVGCWEIAAVAGQDDLVFVVEVQPAAENPLADN